MINLNDESLNQYQHLNYSLLGQGCEDKINKGWDQSRSIDWSISNIDKNYNLSNVYINFMFTIQTLMHQAI